MRKWEKNENKDMHTYTFVVRVTVVGGGLVGVFDIVVWIVDGGGAGGSDGMLFHVGGPS